MKANLKTIMYLFVLIVIAQLVLAVPPIPCAFAGTAKLNTVNIVAGDIVQARDPQGVVCGTFTHPGGGMPAGYYGPLNCKGDDPDTTGIDEGAVANDQITFFINGVEADLAASSTTNDIWVQGGTKYGTNLEAVSGCMSNAECADGLACNGIETCNLATHICEAGTSVSCTANNIPGVASCTNIPEDTNPFT
jgi:hypothetical protein